MSRPSRNPEDYDLVFSCGRLYLVCHDCGDEIPLPTMNVTLADAIRAKVHHTGLGHYEWSSTQDFWQDAGGAIHSRAGCPNIERPASCVDLMQDQYLDADVCPCATWESR